MGSRLLLTWLAACLLLGSCSYDKKYRSPGAMAEGKEVIYVSLTGVPEIAVVSKSDAFDPVFVKIRDRSTSLCADGSRLYVAGGEARGFVDVYQAEGIKLKETGLRFPAGHTPSALLKVRDKLYVANRFSSDVSVIDLKAPARSKTIAVVREPKAMAMTPEGRYLLVANSFPKVSATEEYISTELSVIDTRRDEVVKNIRLSKGAQGVEGICVSPDGKYAYLTHIVSRYGVPITQLDRGWVNSNGISIIDIDSLSLLATVLIDDVDLGAANPKGIAANDRRLFVAVSGTHEMMEIDRRAMHAKIDSVLAGASVYGSNHHLGATTSSVFFVAGSGMEDGNNIRNLEDINGSLTFISELKRRHRIGSLSPQQILLSGEDLYLSCRFTPSLERYRQGKWKTLMLGKEKMDSRRRGELAFCDASLCYQGWQSCASCHPDGRADALNWDQLNDGIGNPKQTKSMLYAHVTPPSMVTGIRESAELAVRKGIIHTLGTVQPEGVADDIDRYLLSLRPVESPYLIDGKLSEKARKGREIFEKARCTVCHNGKYLTDGKKYDVGLKTPQGENIALDTPTLHEIWRTAPYFYDGRALTVMEVLKDYNFKDKHGKTSDLNQKELDELAEYILSL